MRIPRRPAARSTAGQGIQPARTLLYLQNMNRQKYKKIPYVAVAAVFFALCAFFSLGMLLPGGADAADGGEIPRLITEDGLSPNWRDDFETWFSGHFAFRDTLVDAFSLLKERLFRTGNEKVIVGKSGFLFFADTLDCYTGADPMTEEELTAAADSLKALSDYAAERGARFVFLCAPNKNTIYGDKMPASVPASSAPSDLDRLLPLLKERGVTAADVRGLLRDAAGSETVYHRRDTHWNAEGARIAAAAVMAAAGEEIPSWLEEPLTVTTHDFIGDLDAQLYPKRTRYDDDFALNRALSFTYLGNYKTPMDMNVNTVNENAAGSVLMFRDSFANALIPFFAEIYGSASFSRANPYRIDRLEEEGADLVVVEIAERNLRDLIGADARVPGEGK